MKIKSILLILLLISSYKFMNAQFVYNVQTITSNPLYTDNISDVSGEGNGVNYVCGFFNGTMQLGGLSITSFGGTTDHDYFISKMNANGTCAWIQKIGNTNNQTGIIQIYYYAGAVYVCGGFSGVINVGGTSITASGTNDNFVAKYSTAGVFQWASNLALGNTIKLNGLAVGANGIYATYINALSSSNINGGVVKINTTSTHKKLWSADFTMTSTNSSANILEISNRPYDITVDNSNAIYICGTYKARATSGTPSNSYTATYKKSSGATGTSFIFTMSTYPGSESDMFLVKYDNNGGFTWGKRYGNTRDNGSCFGDEATGVTYNANQASVYLTGHFTGSATSKADLGSNITLAPFGGAVSTDIFLSKITPAGITSWASQLGGSDCELGGSITSDNTGNVYLTGAYFTKFSSGCYAINSPNWLTGTVISRFNSSGFFQWLTYIEAAGPLYTTANGGNYNVVCDNVGYVYSVLNSFSQPVYPASGAGITPSGFDGLYSKIKVTPSADAGPDVTIGGSCCTSGVIIGTPAIAGCTYSWSPTTGLSNPAIAQPTCNIGSTYTVTCNNSGCITTDQVIVTAVGTSCCKVGHFTNNGDSNSGLEYNIYPNPSAANSSFFIESNYIDENIERHLSVYSVDGTLVMERKLHNDVVEEIPHHLSPGMYLMIIQSENEKQSFKMTIVE